MSATLLADVESQVQTFWSGLFFDELMEVATLPAIVNRDYEGEIKEEGNAVKVSMVHRPTATRRTVGDRHDSFDAAKLRTSQITVTADQVFTAAFEFDSLIDLQSQIKSQTSKIRMGLLEAMDIALNNFLYSLISPSASSPTHVVSGVTDFNATQVLALRKLAAQAKWRRDQWWLLADPSYHNDMLASQTLTSKDFVEDAPVVAGQMVAKRYGFNIVEDNSEGMAQLSPTAATEDLALAIHRDALLLVLQQKPEFKISDLHGQKRHGYLMSCKMVGGAKAGLQGNVKQIKVYNT